MMRLSRETVTVVTWWMRWVAFQASPFVFYHYIGGSVSSMARPSDSPLWLACLIPLAVASILRWKYLPAAKEPDTVAIYFNLGAGLSWLTCLLGLFLFPPHQFLISVLSGLCIFQFVPNYARRYYPEK